MKALVILTIILALSGCATTAPPGCSGTVRRVNPSSATYATNALSHAALPAVTCPVGVA